MGTYSTQMRTDAESLLHDLAEGGRLVHLERLPAAPGPHRLAGVAAARHGVEGPRRPRAVVPPGRGHRPRPGRAVGGGGHRHRVGQVALLPGRHRRGGRSTAPAGIGPAAVPDQGAGPGPAARARPRSAAGPGGRHLRRRLAARGADLGPPQRQRGAHQPRDAPRRPAPPPRPLGRRSSCGCATSWSTSCTSLRGIFGSHVAHLLRRLRRLCARYGSVADVRLLLGHHRRAGPPGLRAVRPARRGGDRRRLAPRRAPLRALEPAAARRRRPATRASANVEAAAADGRAGRGRAGARSRSAAAARHRAGGRRRPPPPAGRAGRRRVRPYRAGYLAARAPRDRGRAVRRPAAGRRGHHRPRARRRHRRPRRLRAQRLPRHDRLDVAAGRAGRPRASSASLAVLVAGDDQLDQWLMAHPGEVFTPAARAGGGEPGQPLRAAPPPGLRRLRAAADARRRARGGATTSTTACASSCSADRLRLRDGRAPTGSGRGSPAPGLGLRSGSPDEFRIAEPDGRLVGTVDASRAFEQVHPGAIYLHQGQQYRVRARSTSTTAWRIVEPVDGDEYTQVRSDMSVTILGDRRRRRRSAGPALRLGAVEIATQVVGLPAARQPAPARCSGARSSTCRRPAW